MPPRNFALCCTLGYVLASWAVRLDVRDGRQGASLVYPLDTFSMYATPPGPRISHLLMRDRGGVVHRIPDFSVISCGPMNACGTAGAIPYLDRDLLAYVRCHPGPGPLPMTLVRRTWRLHTGGAPQVEGDCVIATCGVHP